MGGIVGPHHAAFDRDWGKTARLLGAAFDLFANLPVVTAGLRAKVAGCLLVLGFLVASAPSQQEEQAGTEGRNNLRAQSELTSHGPLVGAAAEPL